MSQASAPILLEYGKQRFERWPLAAPLLLLAAVSIAFAIQLQDGEYTPRAMALVTIALVATGCAVVWPPRQELPASQHVLDWLFAAAFLLQLSALFTTWPGVDLPAGGRLKLLPLYVGLELSVLTLGAILSAALLVPSNTTVTRFSFLLLLVISPSLCVWSVRSSPNPHIDVFIFQQQASAELLKGHNPYAMTFPDIYHSTVPGRQQVYGDGLVVNDTLQFGFPYLPLSLLLALPGYLIGHDHRYAQAAALALAGLFIGYSRLGRVAMLAAALFLFTPRIFFVLMRGWTEPFVVMLLAATIFCAYRRSRLLPVALGLFLVSKQYMALALPLTFLLLPQPWTWRQWWSVLWKAALVAAAVTLPLALWDWHAFWKSTVTVQETSPFRWDALSYLVWYGFRGHLVTEPWTARFWSTLAAAVAIALSIRKAPRTPAGFAAAVSLVFLAFFAFNKQAFCNYYFFVIGALCCALAAAEPLNASLHTPRRTNSV